MPVPAAGPHGLLLPPAACLLQVLVNTVKKSLWALGLLFAYMFILIVFFSAIMFYCEQVSWESGGHGAMVVAPTRTHGHHHAPSLSPALLAGCGHWQPLPHWQLQGEYDPSTGLWMRPTINGVDTEPTPYTSILVTG